MARPERKTVDYFPHYIGDGKKIFYIEQKYGNDGYATWFKILESLASTENHFLSLNNPMDLLFLSAKCRITEDVLMSILEDFCKLGEIDEFLWLNKIVYSHKFIASIQDAYVRRSNKCMDYGSFCKHYEGLCTTITRLSYDKNSNNTQSKVNNNKEKESKDPIDWKLLLTFINETFNREFRIVSEDVKRKYNARLKDGWKKSDIQKAILSVRNDPFHLENDFKHVTLDYFSRDKTLQIHATGKFIPQAKSFDPWS